MIINSYRYAGGAAPGFDADYQAVLNYATAQGYTLPSAGQQTLQNQLVLDLKSAGVWSKLDLFYLPATDGDSDFATINWKNPSAGFNMIKVNSPVFVTNKGFETDGVSSYLQTNFNVLSSGTNYAQDDMGLFIGFPILDSTTSSNSRVFGLTSNVNYLDIRMDANTLSTNNRIWANTSNTWLGLDFKKVNNSIHFLNRTASNAINYRSVDLATPSSVSSTNILASTTAPNDTITILQDAGTFFIPNSNFGIYGIGSNLTSTEMDDLQTAWYTNYYLNL